MEHILKTKSFPDLGGVFAQMKIRDKLSAVSEKGSFGFSILVALDRKKPLKSILEMIMEQYESCPSEVLDVVDQETIDLIKSLLKKP